MFAYEGVGFYKATIIDELVKSSNLKWLSKKLHKRGVRSFKLFRRTIVRRNDLKIETTK